MSDMTLKRIQSAAAAHERCSAGGRERCSGCPYNHLGLNCNHARHSEIAAVLKWAETAYRQIHAYEGIGAASKALAKVIQTPSDDARKKNIVNSILTGFEVAMLMMSEEEE